MKDVIFDDFQNSVSESLLRHKSILDIITKLQESQSRINRAIAKSATNCGCIKINVEKQKVPNSYESISDLQSLIETHLKGNLCDNCRDVLEKEIGNNLFYLASLCNVLDLNLYDILLKEYDRINTLGKYSLK
ncbi:DUF1573 domain-containing protein [Haloimpatiens lingqiaonensis]|uniref:DUF1573 domain-containing protein n=1 Tax=Haloimpatiens lingqiaonensis TaxID=1380675 RepID=UPI0010FF0A03|nr:DUF1573 domain-containing protein [Haloimpatiens lingqiaonensis]